MPINSNHVLVVGGAGFIGSHMVLALNAAGYQPIVLDNLSKGHRDSVFAPLVVGDMGDKSLLRKLFSNYQFTAVMHFASLIEVAESVVFPAAYYQNNVAASLTLFDVMREFNVRKLIYSSTAAVYGEPKFVPISEDHILSPINPYGRSKRMVEEIIRDYANNKEFDMAILRYFNAAGADPEGRLGECHQPESHLIPLVLNAALDSNKFVNVFGRDYPTIDGTCVRDYVHVHDLCEAHLLALNALNEGRKQLIYNLGTGNGYSVQQVIDTATYVTNKNIYVIDQKRRSGDPAILIADASIAKRELKWQPKYSELETIIKHSWQFINKNGKSLARNMSEELIQE